MYFNSFANYYAINGLQTCAKCVLVCAGPIAGLLAGAGSQSSCYFYPSTHSTHIFQFFCQLFRHKYASNVHQMYPSMCRSQCQSIGQCQQPFIFWIFACLPMYLNFCANYFGINRLQTCTKFMLVCASPIASLASPLAGAQNHSFFCLSAHTIDVFQFFCQLFRHK